MPGGGGEWARLELTEPLIKNVILPGKLSILCDIQYLNKTAQNSFENIEQLGIFYFLTLLHNANEIKANSTE